MAWWTDYKSNKRLFCKHMAALVLSSCPRGRDFGFRGQTFSVQPLMDIQHKGKRCYSDTKAQLYNTVNDFPGVEALQLYQMLCTCKQEMNVSVLGKTSQRWNTQKSPFRFEFTNNVFYTGITGHPHLGGIMNTQQKVDGRREKKRAKASIWGCIPLAERCRCSRPWALGQAHLKHREKFQK